MYKNILLAAVSVLALSASGSAWAFGGDANGNDHNDASVIGQDNDHNKGIDGNNDTNNQNNNENQNNDYQSPDGNQNYNSGSNIAGNDQNQNSNNDTLSPDGDQNGNI